MAGRRGIVVSFTVFLVVALLAPASLGASGRGELAAIAAAGKIDPKLVKRFDREPI